MFDYKRMLYELLDIIVNIDKIINQICKTLRISYNLKVPTSRI